MVMMRPARTCLLRISTLVATMLVFGLVIGWSCRPSPAAPDVRIELIQSAWLEDPDMILMVTSIDESDPYRTHGRLELSWLNQSGNELFRSLYNTSSHANPVPPGAFGVFALEDGSVLSAGIEGDWDVTQAGFTLLTDSATVRRDGILSVNWAIRPPESLVGPVELRARVIPRGRDTADWQSIGRLELSDGAWLVAEGSPTELAAARNTPIGDGEAEAVLRSLGELWAQGVDPKTIEEIRARAIKRIGETGRFSVGRESYPLRDIRTVYEWMLMTPDVLRHRLVTGADLEPERMLFLAVAVGREHLEPAQEHAEYVLPEIGIVEAVQNADPWVVSAALFMARKQQIELGIDEVLGRWQGQRAWDDVCTEQALLYLAGRHPAELENVVLPPEAARLEEANPAGIEIHPWFYLSSGDWSAELVTIPPGRGFVFEVRDSTMDVITERPVGPDEGTLELPATRNYYSFRHLDGSMHGSSRFVEGKAGRFVRMPVAIEGGV